MLIAGSLVVGLVLLAATIANIHDVPGWVKWNYEGYEGKQTYPEYQALMEEIDRLPPGEGVLRAEAAGAVAVSALQRTGLGELLERAEDALWAVDRLDAPLGLAEAEPIASIGRGK